MDEKKDSALPALRITVIVPDPVDPEAHGLALDERWSCVAKKLNPVWIRIALCRKTWQGVAYAIGDRSETTCWKRWIAIPACYRESTGYRDFWAAYQAVILDDQHIPVGKETDETAHGERWNTTLRQRLGRFVRKTLSFSKALAIST